MIKIWPVHLVLLLCLLCSCSSQPSGSVVNTAIAQTQAAQPTVTSIPPTSTTVPPTATAIPLKDLKLESIIFQPGDLPASYTQSEVTHTPRFLTEDQQKLLVNGVQILLNNSNHAGGAGGSVTVAIFSSNFDRDKVYEYLKADGLSTSNYIDLPGIGEEAVRDAAGADIIFTRCYALARIVLAPDSDYPAALEYAKTLDKRVSSLVCP